MPESRARERAGSTPSASSWCSSCSAPLTYGIIEGPRLGWTSVTILGLFVLAVAALVGLLCYEPRRGEPLMDLRFFRSAPFAGATVIAVCAFAGLGGFLFLNTLYLQEVRGFSRAARRPAHAAAGGR